MLADLQGKTWLGKPHDESTISGTLRNGPYYWDLGLGVGSVAFSEMNFTGRRILSVAILKYLWEKGQKWITVLPAIQIQTTRQIPECNQEEYYHVSRL